MIGIYGNGSKVNLTKINNRNLVLAIGLVITSKEVYVL